MQAQRDLVERRLRIGGQVGTSGEVLPQQAGGPGSKMKNWVVGPGSQITSRVLSKRRRVGRGSTRVKKPLRG